MDVALKKKSSVTISKLRYGRKHCSYVERSFGFGVKLYLLCDCKIEIVLVLVVYIGKDTKAYVKENKSLGNNR